MKGKIFNAQEVQALFAGNKTQFREIVKGQPTLIGNKASYAGALKVGSLEGHRAENREDGWWICDDYAGSGVECPYQVGQKIFCKESFEIWDDGLVYKSDNSPANIVSKWKPAQHMKQEHSRLTLLIKEIRVEKLQKLGFGDALREGTSGSFEGSYDGEMLLEKFKSSWNATHKKPEEKFEASPWVWCVSFEIINN